MAASAAGPAALWVQAAAWVRVQLDLQGIDHALTRESRLQPVLAGEAPVQALGSRTALVQVEFAVLVMLPCTHGPPPVGTARAASPPRHRLLRKQPLPRRRLQRRLFLEGLPCSTLELLQRRSARRQCAVPRLTAACEQLKLTLKPHDCAGSPGDCTDRHNCSHSTRHNGNLPTV